MTTIPTNVGIYIYYISNLYYIYLYTLTDSMCVKLYMEGKINYNYLHGGLCMHMYWLVC